MNSTLDFWQDIQYKLRLNRKKWWYGTNMTTLDWCWILGYRYWKSGHDFLFFFIYKYSFRLQGVQDISFFFQLHKWWKSEISEVSGTAVGRFAWKMTFQQHSHRQTTRRRPRGFGRKKCFLTVFLNCFHGHNMDFPLQSKWSTTAIIV